MLAREIQDRRGVGDDDRVMTGDSASSIAGVAPEPSSIRRRGSKWALDNEAACRCKNTRAELQWKVLRGGRGACGPTETSLCFAHSHQLCINYVHVAVIFCVL